MKTDSKSETEEPNGKMIPDESREVSQKSRLPLFILGFLVSATIAFLMMKWCDENLERALDAGIILGLVGGCLTAIFGEQFIAFIAELFTTPPQG